jgi:hypothetical protein
MSETWQIVLFVLIEMVCVFVGYEWGFSRGRRRERMSTLDLTHLHYTPRPAPEPAVDFSEAAHLTRWSADSLSRPVGPKPADAPPLQEAMMRHIRSRKP